MDDVIGASSLEELGRDTIMWGSDVPHTDSTWPHSQQVIEKNLVGVSPATAARVLHDNAATLYRMEP
jgi:predicted TIM-barrel fold metal-dependent hydrolase